ncbi:MAG: hypothetical protein JW795_08925 [Chitinivibrionales bacterium]|nr:hypothetical protein [Chitinivibrionales bacterium]
MRNNLFIAAVLLYAYPIGFFISSFLLRKIIIFINKDNSVHIGGKGINIHNVGFWIGLCEHFLIVTFVFLNQYTALGILVAARGILRAEDIKEGKRTEGSIDRASYFLIGMLLSISFALFFGITGRALANALHITKLAI